MMSLMMLSMIFVMISMSTASIRRISEIIKETPDLHNGENPAKDMKDGSVDFNNVSFSYKHGSGKMVLNNIDLHIRSGETIGIIGSTGCGKTSLVNLISRLYDVDRRFCMRWQGRKRLRYGISERSGFCSIAEERAFLRHYP